MIVLRRFIAASIILLAGTGCVPTSQIVAIDNLDQLAADKVLIVGKVELDPPLAADEQDLGESYEEYRNAVMIITDTELRDTSGELAYGDLSSRIDAKIGEHFFVGHSAEPFFILKTWVVMRAKLEIIGPGESYESGNAPLYGTFRVDVRPDDKAVYVGTIRYYRDDFFGTKKIVIKDDYAAAQAEFRRKFGDAMKLRKALVQPILQQ